MEKLSTHMKRWANERISLSRWQWFAFWGLAGLYLTLDPLTKESLIGGLVLTGVLVVLIFGSKAHGDDL